MANLSQSQKQQELVEMTTRRLNPKLRVNVEIYVDAVLSAQEVQRREEEAEGTPITRGVAKLRMAQGMCDAERPYQGIKEMIEWGINTILGKEE